MEHSASASFIRPAAAQDAGRIAEILVFNNRLNFFPIFKDEQYSFCEMQVVPLAQRLAEDQDALSRTFVWDDGVLRGFVRVQGREVEKLFVDPCFQGRGVGAGSASALAAVVWAERRAASVMSGSAMAGGVFSPASRAKVSIRMGGSSGCVGRFVSAMAGPCMETCSSATIAPQWRRMERRMERRQTSACRLRPRPLSGTGVRTGTGSGVSMSA